MKTMIAAAAAVLALASAAHAGPYFRLADPSHLQWGVGVNIAPKTPSATSATTDLALITHSTADGTIIPETWQGVIPRESWTPLQIGFGGSFKGEATIAIGASANVAPIIATNLLRSVDSNSNGVAQAIKAAMLGQGQGAIRLGGALAGVGARDGHFQSFSAAFPGQGIGEILGNAARVNAGYAWKF